MLRQLAGYYHKEPDCLFMVRIAQGLVHMGKGTIGINPFYLDRTILNKPAVAGLLATLTAFTDAKACKCSDVIFDDELTPTSPQSCWKSTIGCSTSLFQRCTPGSSSL
jgi:hypothetical protein